jgi:(heptosyl)LPS beta-1,4-glucosyltransferase
MSKSISAVIITHNEERNIERCIRSLQGVADEIIVLDSNSNDRTEEICKNLNVTFIKRDWEGYSASKNYANEQASGAYILSIDADEEVSEELKRSILDEKKKGLNGVYEVNRLTNYCGKWIYHSGWYPDLKIRLFPKEGSQWEGALVHEELTYRSGLKLTKLQGHLNHYSYVSYEQHRSRADHYSRLTARKYAEQGKKAGILAPFLSGAARFISMYFLKKGILDGYMGFKIAVISAQSNVYKYKELRRINREGNKAQ